MADSAHRHTFPIWPQEDGVYMAQAVTREYMNVPLAVATAVFYRYTRINCGFGATAKDLGPATSLSVDAVLDRATTAMSQRSTHSCAVQTTLAQWLAVYAGLQETAGTPAKPVGTFLTLDVAKLPTGTVLANDARSFRNNVDGVADGVHAGNTAIAPAVLLTYLAEWYGAAHPLFNGRRDAVLTRSWSALKTIIAGMDVAAMPAGSVVGTALRQGLVQPWDVFINNLNAVFGHGAAGNPHKVRLVAAHAANNLQKYYLAENMALLQASGHCADASLLAYASTDATYVPTDMAVTQAEAGDIGNPANAFVVLSKQGAGPVVADAVLPVTGDAPLQYLAVSAAVSKLVNSLPDAQRVGLDTDVVAQVWRLFPRYPKQTIEADVAKAMRIKYGGADVLFPAAPPPPLVALPPADPSTLSLIIRVKELDELVSGVARAPALPVPKPIDDLASTLTAAFAAPRNLRPGRWFTAGPALVSLYFDRAVWSARACVSATAVLSAFFTAVAGVQFEGARRCVLRDGVVKADIVPEPSKPGWYALRPVAKAPPLASALRRTGMPVASVVLTSLDLLSVAVHPDQRVRDTFAQLWNRHHAYDAGGIGWFKEEHNASLAKAAMTGDLSLAMNWRLGPIMQLAFELGDTTVQPLLDKLQSAVADHPVVVYNNQMYCSRRAVGNSVTLHSVLLGCAPGTGLEVRPSSSQTVVLGACIAWSQPFLHGFGLTTGQLALLFALGTATEVYALNWLTKFAAQEYTTIACDFVHVLARDRQEIAERFQQLRHADTMSFMSAATHLTLS